MIEKLYTVEEVAELASVTGRTIRNYLKSGRLVGRKIGGQWRFPESEVQRLLTGAEPEPPKQQESGAPPVSAQPSAPGGDVPGEEQELPAVDFPAPAVPFPGSYPGGPESSDYAEPVEPQSEGPEPPPVTYASPEPARPAAPPSQAPEPLHHSRPTIPPPQRPPAAEYSEPAQPPRQNFFADPRQPMYRSNEQAPGSAVQPAVQAEPTRPAPLPPQQEAPRQQAPPPPAQASHPYTPAPQPPSPVYTHSSYEPAMENNAAPPMSPSYPQEPFPPAAPVQAPAVQAPVTGYPTYTAPVYSQPPAYVQPPAYEATPPAAYPVAGHPVTTPVYGAPAQPPVVPYYAPPPAAPPAAAQPPPAEAAIEPSVPHVPPETADKANKSTDSGHENAKTAPPLPEFSDVGKRVTKFISEVHECSQGPQICAVIDLHQPFAAARTTSEQLADIATQESASGLLCQSFVEFDERYFVARYTLFGTSMFLYRCLKILG